MTRLPGGCRFFVTYQWGKPQLDEVENAQGQVSPTDKLLKRPARRPKAEEKASCPIATFAVIPLIIE